MFSSSGERNDESLWSFSVIENLFDYVKAISRSKVSTYSIYGHSAGAQFVHRLVMFKPNARVRTAIAANAGWYTMPIDAKAFPYGLRDSGRDRKAVATSFGKNLVILLGDKDTDENDKYLRKTAEAMEQGNHRFARGHSFYKMARDSAKKEDVAFKWRLHVVRGVGHSNSRMSTHAVKLLS
jgi:pimeloyl-ACP methyl ester carboxylesterase